MPAFQQECGDPVGAPVRQPPARADWWSHIRGWVSAHAQRPHAAAGVVPIKRHYRVPRAVACADGHQFRHPAAVAAFGEDPIEGLADRSDWLPFAEAVTAAPRLPGVYMARQGADGRLVYVGLAGERRGQGIRGRLTVYRRGKAAVSGLGEAVLDRALADVGFVQGRLEEPRAGGPERTAVWAQDAITWANLHVRWAVTKDRPAAVTLERAVLDASQATPLWNRAR